jgi:hypothetical protein
MRDNIGNRAKASWSGAGPDAASVLRACCKERAAPIDAMTTRNPSGTLPAPVAGGAARRRAK